MIIVALKLISMTCPHCHENLPADYASPWCPYCGKNLATPTALPGKTVSAGRKFKVRLFVGALLLPPSLTLLSAAVMRFILSPNSDNENISPFIGLVGGVGGGIICGVLLGSLFRHPGLRVIFSFLLSLIMIGLGITLCCFGCTLGGYQLRVGG
jgi:hypothetical protein